MLIETISARVICVTLYRLIDPGDLGLIRRVRKREACLEFDRNASSTIMDVSEVPFAKVSRSKFSLGTIVPALPVSHRLS